MPTKLLRKLKNIIKEVVVDCDLKSYFDTIHHQRIRGYLDYFISDKIVLRLIWKFLRSGILDEDIYIETKKGAPQGGPLPPILANVYLNMLDRELEKRGHRFVRYADDFVIYVKSRRAGERVMESVTTFLEQDLQLTINQMKLANSRKGYWRLSRNGIIHRAITKERLKKWGLKDMSQLYESRYLKD